MIYIAPSLLSADLARLAEAVASVAETADYIHCDVMDGHFVPNLTFGAPVVAAIKRVAPIPLDVHLMIDNPGRWVDDYFKAGLNESDFLTFHVEAEHDPGGVLKRIRQAGVRPGLAVKPGTPVEPSLEYLDLCHQILIMTVEPGFGGQSFKADMLNKIRTVRERCSHSDLVVGVDGGVDATTARECVRAGANLLVAGSAVYGKPDPAKAVISIRTGAM